MKKQYLLNFVLFFLGANSFAYLANLLFDWSFDRFHLIIQNFIVGIIFSWILTQAQQYNRNKKKF